MELRTPRLILREFKKDDWAAVLAYQIEPRYLRYNPWTSRSQAEVEAFIGQFIKWQSEKARSKFQLAITLAENQQLIGNCGLRLNGSRRWEGELGYEIAPSHWGHGYATEAAEAMLAFGFETLHLHRIWASIISENLGSVQVAEKLGMRREGRLREDQWLKGRWWDTLIYGMLIYEWQATLPR
jgi:RimJ/RimL family protein N-acetyltransferase